jgi:histidinol-phosphate aminotransferase
MFMSHTFEDDQDGVLSRRGFLKGAAAGGAIAALSPWEMAEALVAGEAKDRTIRGVGVEPGVVAIGSNENPLGASPRAIEAVLKHMGSSNRYYRSQSLEEALIRYHGIDYEPPRRQPGQRRQAGPILMAAGSGQTLESIALTFLEKEGDEMIAAHPSYGSIERKWEANSGVVHLIPLNADYQHDLKGMLAKVNDKTKVVSICNPNNPTGTIIPHDEIEALVDAVPAHVLVVVDEAYIEFVEDEAYKTAMDLAASRENVIAIRTFSKIYGLAGVRVGYSVAHKNIHQQMLNYHYTNGIGLYGMVAAEAALQDAEHARRSKELATEAKRYYEKECEDMGLEYVKSESSFMLINLNRDARSVGRELAKRRIFVADAERRWGLKGWTRVSVGTKAEAEAFMTALREIMNTAL